MVKSDKDMFDRAKLWDLPSVDDQLAEHEASTNALNRPRGKWKFEAPEEEKEIAPLTAEDIEEIREAAHQEGLKNGQEEGFQKGYEEGLVEGSAAGHEQGKATGLEQGLAESKTSIDEQSAKLEALISALQQPLANVQQEVQKELVLLAKTLAHAIIKVEIQQNEQVLIKAIEEGIKALPIQESQYQITLHPADIEWVTQHYTPEHIGNMNWLLIPSEDIQQGGCKIQTKNNAVDVSIEKRCNEVFSQLLFEQGLVDDPRTK